MKFAEKISTKICYEKPNTENPFVADESYIHGYNLFDLMQNCSGIDVFYLIFRGELPSHEHSQLFNALMIGLINPGPRHPASRAAMTAAVSKSGPENILPIGLLSISGQHLGAIEAYEAAKFLENNIDCEANALAETYSLASHDENESGKTHTGFGTRFGSRDPLSNRLANHLAMLPAAGAHLAWGEQFTQSTSNPSLGWLTTGLAAAALLDLGFHRRDISGLFQLLSAPGLLAYGLEQSFKQVTDMPFIPDERYETTENR